MCSESSSLEPPQLLSDLNYLQAQISPLKVNLDQKRLQLASASREPAFEFSGNQYVTNFHVVHGCRKLRVNGIDVVGAPMNDEKSDLSLLRSQAGQTSVATIRIGRSRVGETVAVAGFPLHGVLSGFNFTTGTLSSLAGPGGDTRLIQITAPVQPGNSGGPLLDSSGNVMGVVVSKLDAVKFAQISGDIPQNVNFAINANTLQAFLDANGVDYRTAGPGAALPATEVASRAKNVTVLVECWK